MHHGLGACHCGSERCSADEVDASDEALLDFLTGPTPPKQLFETSIVPPPVLGKKKMVRRDAVIEPLMIAAAAASGPHVTRNHYHHDFYPSFDPKAEGAWDWTNWKGDAKNEGKRLRYVSRQAPRSKRLAGVAPVSSASTESDKENDVVEPLKKADNLPLPTQRRASLSAGAESTALTFVKESSSTLPLPPLEVKCMARTRIPTPHGPAFLHLYHNNRDSKEHLAIVIDSAQYSPSPSLAPPIRSRTLDAIWGENETEMDRITRGAYVGRLSATNKKPSTPYHEFTKSLVPSGHIPAPLVRIHSECFTGETVGSQRCDCGEQLDEAIRLISLPVTITASDPYSPTVSIPGRGAIIYLRQEGRGIGLLSKIRAYNLQDLGYDTVAANLILGHGADERAYDIAGAILRDFGLGGSGQVGGGEDVRLLTNNPDKVAALEGEGVKVVERVPMIPRAWQGRSKYLNLHRDPVKSLTSGFDTDHSDESIIVRSGSNSSSALAPSPPPPGATLIGGGAVHGEDLDKYLRTKVLKMGHMLPLWMQEDPEAA